MAWTELTRKRYERSGGRYASDASDAEWALIAPLLAAPRRVGRPRTTALRDVFDAILYIATTGCQWRMLPNDFPPGMVITVLGMVADMELKFIRDRQRTGIEAAKRQGVYKGRQKRVDDAEIRRLSAQGVSKAQTARDLKVSRMTVYWALEDTGLKAAAKTV